MEASVILFFAGGLLLLVGGAELLVRGASRLAAAMGLSPLIIGLTMDDLFAILLKEYCILSALRNIESEV